MYVCMKIYAYMPTIRVHVLRSYVRAYMYVRMYLCMDVYMNTRKQALHTYINKRTPHRSSTNAPVNVYGHPRPGWEPLAIGAEVAS